MKSKWFAIAGLFCSLTLAASLQADEDLEKRATWQQPTAGDIKGQVDQWLAERQADDVTLARVEAVWSDDMASAFAMELLDRLAATISLADETTTALVDLCGQGGPAMLPPSFEFLQDAGMPPLMRNNLRLYYGRWLAQQEFYDESLAQIGDLQPEDVADPASLLFYQGVCHHRLLQKDECLKTLARLLENKGQIPKRYETLAMLMEADLSPLKTDSLDEIARLMDDIERRLGFGRAGTRVRKEEDDVVAKLDKMIEELQKQQQQQQSGAGGGQGGQPMQDSMPGGGSGPGEVEQRRIGSRAGWGDLPPKKRQEALQQIAKGLPSHYRQVIEEYFRKLARDGSE
jgi:hypothetical protein